MHCGEEDIPDSLGGIVDPTDTPFENTNRLRFRSGNYGNNGPTDGSNGPPPGDDNGDNSDNEPPPNNDTINTSITVPPELEHMLILCKPTFDQEQQGGTYVVTQKIRRIYHL